VVPQEAYRQGQTVPLLQAAQSVIAADGTATVTVGPSGVGAKWYPNTATFGTTSGPSTSCFVILYAGFVSQATLLNGQAYSGGGDTAGLAIPQMTPGDVIVAQWSGGIPGDTATLTVTGSQSVLL
jgi:hypothetical protein